jgi:PAS domain S-box-containing protein
MPPTQTSEPAAASPENEAVLQLDGEGSVASLSDPARALFGAVSGVRPDCILRDASGAPLTPEFFATLLAQPELEPLRRTGLSLQACTAGGERVAVRVVVEPGSGETGARLVVRREHSPSDVAGLPARALLAASRGRAALLRHAGRRDAMLQGFCQALIEAGYAGAVVHLGEEDDPERLTPAAWARPGGGAEAAQAPEPLNLGGADDGVAEALRTGRPGTGRCLPRWLEGWVGQAGAEGASPCLTLPVGAEGGPVRGVVGLFGEDPAGLAEPEVGLLAGLAQDLGRSLAACRPEAGTNGREDDLAGMLEAAPDFLAVLDQDGTLRYLNRAGVQLLGCAEAGDCLGHRLSEFQPDGAGSRFLDEALPAALESGSWRGESALVSAHGTEIPVDQTLVAEADEDGGNGRLFTIIRDISDRKQEEARLRDSEEKYRRILEAAQEGFWIVHDQLQGDERPQLRFKVPVSKGSRIVLLDLPEVRYFQADGHYTQVYTDTGNFLCNLSVSDLERRLDSTQFLRIHRSYILNLQFIQVLERVDDQWMVTVARDDGERLPVSRRNVEKVKVMLGVS